MIGVGPGGAGGPTVHATSSAIDPARVREFARGHEVGGFDNGLVGYTARAVA